MIHRSDIEILAPVGSFESLAAAVDAGADAVYFGVHRLNMRSHSTVNFSFDDVQKITSLCRKKNIKTYLTLNTVIYDEEMQEMEDIVIQAKKHKVDALIVSDQAAITCARKHGMEVHISTQLNISNVETIRFYAAFADVVVLARELNLQQVKHIAAAIQKENICGPSGKPIRLEMFVHGALCVSISGKCYLSLHEYNKAANRGECYQVCRRAYRVTDTETGVELEVDNRYIMSPKDICTIGFLDKMLDAGVRVLKIEGRARSAEYVKVVTQCYREAVEALCNGRYNAQAIDAWKQRLATVFNRGFWDGYYLGQKLGEWNDSYGSKATRQKEYIGKITNYFTKQKVAEITLESGKLTQGEEILIIGTTTGVLHIQVSEIRVDFKPVRQAQKGEVCSVPVDTFLRRSDKVYRWVQR